MAEIKDRNTMGNVVRFTREYFDSIFVEERLVGAKRASLKMELFGEEFDSADYDAGIFSFKNICQRT